MRNTYYQAIHQKCAENEPKEVNTNEYHVWYKLIYRAENRQGTIIVRTDKEHIKRLVDAHTHEHLIHSDIQRHSNKYHNDERQYSTDKESRTQPILISHRK